MLFSIIVNLYAVRVIWQVLGIDDYGIYNVVAGIVMMFSFINSGMVASSQRFISFELGRRDFEKLNKVFSISLTVHALIAILVLILAETIGVWFLNSELNIPDDRMNAANWIYQFSILSFMVTIISVPYNACIVAHEHMKAYGYFGILEVVLKLVIVFLLMVIPGDKLIVYGLLLLAVSVLMRIIYGIYCAKNFQECHYSNTKDFSLIKEMFSFAGWSFVGNMGFSVRDQGINFILNMFFNVAVNAAKGIANNVATVISGFALNFQMAMNPQITKRYAAGEIDSMLSLIYSGCKYSCFLLLIFVIPIGIGAEPILKLWLGDVAPYTVGFLQLMLVMATVDSMVSPITTALQATGKIKKFQIIISLIMISTLVFSWIWLKFQTVPYVVMYVCIAISAVALVTRLRLLHELVAVSYRKFLKNAILPSVAVTAVSLTLGLFIYQYFSTDFLGLVAFGAISCMITALAICFLGLSSKERNFVKNMVAARLKIRK